MAQPVIAEGLKQSTPPLLSRGASLFSGAYRAAWGPVQAALPPTAAPVVPVPTREERSGGGMGPAFSSMGQTRYATPEVQPHQIVPGAPQLTNVENNPPWWKPTIAWWRPAPAFARKVRVFSDNPLPVPALQAYSSNPVRQRPARLGGQRVERWPVADITYPTFGPGGT
ncbi:MAG: hypothetical protein M0T72_01915 [Candidatus Dormibacteraeota bacterium]|nr:hypothetical protein [Candidatus Dormibacteraeota bacterium]